MRKALVSYSLILCILCIYSSLNSFAQGDVNISFKVGVGTFFINGKEITAEKAFIKDSVTLVPLRIIVDAFGIPIIWDGNEKSLKIIFGDKEIKLFIGRKLAFINDEKFPLICEPVISNGRTMVPIRFISENLGADVHFDDYTKSIRVTKTLSTSTTLTDKPTPVIDKPTPITGKPTPFTDKPTPYTDKPTPVAYKPTPVTDKSNAITDFSSILKSTTKSKIGDSYNSWSMSLPKNMKLANRNFDGTKTTFATYDDKTAICINIKKKKDETVDYLMTELLKYTEKYELLKQGIGTLNGNSYANVIFKKEGMIVNERNIVIGDKIFVIVHVTQDDENYFENDEVNKLLNSFTFKLDKSDTSIEDLSNIKINGYRTYQNKKFNWSLELLPDWTEIKDEENPKENLTRFISDTLELIDFEMYSIETGDTLDKLIEDEEKYNREKRNPARFKNLIAEKTKIHGNWCYFVLSESMLNKDKYYKVELFSVGKKYKYRVLLMLNSDSYNNKTHYDKLKKIVESFTYEETDSKVNNKFAMIDNKNKPITYRKLTNSTFGWSIDIPNSWTSTKDNDDHEVVAYQDELGALSTEFVILKNVDYANVIKYYENDIVKKATISGNLKSLKKEVVTEKGTIVTKYYNEIIKNSSVFMESYYITNKGTTTYAISLHLKDFNNTDINRKILDHIWNSLIFN